MHRNIQVGLILIGLCTFALKGYSQGGMYIAPAGTFFIRSGTPVFIDSLVLTPSTDYLITGENRLQRKTTVTHPIYTPYISRVYDFSPALTSYHGSISMYYSDDELNGISENSVVLNMYDGNNWNAYPNNVTRNAPGNSVSTSGLSDVTLSELTLAGEPMITNKPPVSNGWLMKYLSPTSVLLNGWGSYDPEGGRITFAWTQVAGPDTYRMFYANASTPVIFDLGPGTYTFRLTVTDEQGASSTSDVTFTIQLITNKPPVANGWLMKFLTSNSVLMNAWGSYDPEGGKITYAWTKIAGPDGYKLLYANASTPIFSDLANGTYTVRLTVTDVMGAMGTSDVTFTVTMPMSTVRPQSGNGLYADENNRSLSGVKPYVSVYPNPVSDVLNVKWSSEYKGNGKLTIVDALGKVVKESMLYKEQVDYSGSINVGSLKPGVYSMSIRTWDGQSYVRRLMKK
jgi:hypothetical protein